MNKRAPYVPPVSWDRFDAMMLALYQHQHEGRAMDPAQVAEILDAVHKLRTIYQEEFRKPSANKRPDQRTLRQVAIAHQLVRVFGENPAEAMIAADPKFSESIERDSLTARYRRLKKQFPGDVGFPGWDDVNAALWRLRNPGVDVDPTYPEDGKTPTYRTPL